MGNKVRHILGLSGGKDSTALAIWMRQKYPDIPMEYFFVIRTRNYQKPMTTLDGLKLV